ncbi:hypothetical protein Tco_0871519 [Tanacetum coccineum]
MTKLQRRRQNHKCSCKSMNETYVIAQLLHSSKLKFASVSNKGSGFGSMFSIPSSTINLLNVASSRGLVKISAS